MYNLFVIVMFIKFDDNNKGKYNSQRAQGHDKCKLFNILFTFNNYYYNNGRI